MPKAKAKLSWSAALEIYILSEPHSGEDRSITPESPAWFAWLAERSSFAFQGQQGSFSALLEAVQRGERYWYAYLRTGQQVRKGLPSAAGVSGALANEAKPNPTFGRQLPIPPDAA